MKKFTIELKWAIIFMASLLIWMFLEKLVGLHDEHIDLHQYVTMLYMIPAILIYVLALKDVKSNFYGGKMSYKQGFISGLIISVIVTVFSPLNQWIISEVITPDYFENVIAYSVETGYHENIEDAKAQFNLETYIIQSTVWALGMGIITSAIVALFVKTKS